MKEYLAEHISKVLKELNAPSEIKLTFEKPKLEVHGDLTTNIAMLLAKPLGRKPRDVAEEILNHLSVDNELIDKIEIAGPGFINFHFTDRFYTMSLNEILQKGSRYGVSDSASGKKANVEFVSANPTGPLSVGHGRQAALGDTIANLLSAVGYDVTREYYYNNAGRQMRMLAESTYARYRQISDDEFPFPEEGYQGNYITDIAQDLYEEIGNKLEKMDYEQSLNICKDFAEGRLFNAIKNVCRKMGVEFDVFFNEDSLYRKKTIDEVINSFRSKGLAYDSDGAVWLKTTELGLNKDRVIVKSSGEPTYRLPDIAYHKDKFERGYDLIVDIFGADHIATFPDVLAGVKALGYNTDKVFVVIHQFVTLMRDGEQVKMSKRLANYVTLDELIDEVGSDAVRFFFLMRAPSSHLEFDLNLAKEQSEKNPVYYLQYAHARIASILRFGESEGVIPKETEFKPELINLNLLTEKAEIGLARVLLEFPEVIESSALSFEPHRLTLYLSDVATAFHKFYQEHRVIIPERDMSLARLGLCLATKTVLANGLKILGVSTPERM
jgi:arginyl-tRNA synthetase